MKAKGEEAPASEQVAFIEQARRRMEELLGYTAVFGPSNASMAYDLSKVMEVANALSQRIDELRASEDGWLFYINVLSAAMQGKAADTELAAFRAKHPANALGRFLDRYWGSRNAFYMFPLYAGVMTQPILAYLSSKFTPVKWRAIVITRDERELKVTLFIKEERRSFVSLPLAPETGVAVIPILYDRTGNGLYSLVAQIMDNPIRPQMMDALGISASRVLGNGVVAEKTDWSPELFLLAETGRIEVVLFDEFDALLLRKMVVFDGAGLKMLSAIKSKVAGSPPPTLLSGPALNALMAD